MSSSTSSSSEGRSALGAFLWRVVIFGVSLAVVLGVVAWLGPHITRVDYFDAMEPKHARLNSLDGPKVIVIGGSSAAFSIDSKEIEKVLCRPVVNMSIHAALGFGYLAREIHGRIGEGDVIIVGLEQSNFADPEKWNNEHRMLLDRYPEGLDPIPVLQRPRTLIDVAIMRLQAIWKKMTHPNYVRKEEAIYKASSFNERGDAVAYDVVTEFDTLPLFAQEFEGQLVGDAFLPIWEQLSSEAEAVGASVVFIWPAIARSSYNAQRDAALYNVLNQLDLPLVGIPDQCVYPDSAFLDTPYHIKHWGRRVRTEKLLNDLCRSSYVRCCKDPLVPGTAP